MTEPLLPRATPPPPPPPLDPSLVWGPAPKSAPQPSPGDELAVQVQLNIQVRSEE